MPYRRPDADDLPRNPVPEAVKLVRRPDASSLHRMSRPEPGCLGRRKDTSTEPMQGRPKAGCSCPAPDDWQDVWNQGRRPNSSEGPLEE
jgi:hypothetical protein